MFDFLQKKKNEKLVITVGPNLSPESEGQLMSSSSNNPRIEVVRRLRERLEPILLFGETEQQFLKRLRAIEVQDFGDYNNYENDYENLEEDKFEDFEEDLRNLDENDKANRDSSGYGTSSNTESPLGMGSLQKR